MDAFHASSANPDAGPVRLGLIGDNIQRSRSPGLHRISGELCGLKVSYELLIPKDLGLDFEVVFSEARGSGMRGLNITYPYKERVTGLAEFDDPQLRAIKALNTIVFDGGKARGFNTDFTGFVAAFREAFEDMPPGRVAVIGAGGVGRAIAFALARLGAEELHLTDIDAEKASGLAGAIGALAGTRVKVSTANGMPRTPLEGIVNCTPMGMTGNPGSAARPQDFEGKTWAFDAVYTPIETEFTATAARMGVPCLSGFELFFNQGMQAFEIFTGHAVDDPSLLRERLVGEDARRRAKAAGS